MQVAQHFVRGEFTCQCGCDFSAVDVELVAVLEDVRARFGEPVRISGGNRCAAHNATIEGAAPGSYHVKGMAADIMVSRVRASEVYKYLTEKYPTKYGIGLYSNRVHIDVRRQKARW